MSVANDNTASVSFEGLVGNLLRVGAVYLSKLEGDFQYVPYEGLSEELAKIQEVKIAYFERFWEPSGKVAVWTLAAAATEVGLIPWARLLFFFCLFFIKLFCLRRSRFLVNLRRTIKRPKSDGLLRGMTPATYRGLRSRD